MKVLIVDDEKAIVDILEFNLCTQGYETVSAYDGKSGLELAESENPDVILLDVMLPVMDGFTVLKTIRSRGNNVPIIMITAKEEEHDKVFGLENGADDYITKPFSLRELLARVKANARRSSLQSDTSYAASETNIVLGELTFNGEKRTLLKNGDEVDLTSREFDLIKYLISSPGKVVGREELMREVWQFDYVGDVRAIDVTVRRIREKIEDNPAEPKYLLTKRGAGYYINESVK